MLNLESNQIKHLPDIQHLSSLVELNLNKNQVIRLFLRITRSNQLIYWIICL